MPGSLYLYEIGLNRKYWVVRSGRSGKYIDHFRKYDVTAIGHVDAFISPDFLGSREPDDDGRYFLSREECENIIAAHLDCSVKQVPISRGQIANISGQIKRFLIDLKVDDVVISSSTNAVMSGRILSDPYVCFEKMEITEANGNEEKILTCGFVLRRKVVWAQRYNRNTIPYVLESSFRNFSTVSQIRSEDKISILNHWLTPAHIAKGTLHLSSRIETKDSIGNRSMTLFSRLLDRLEVLSYSIALSLERNESISLSNYPSYLEGSDSYRYSLTTQQAFMSPGDHFLQLAASKTQLKVYAILFAAIFNADLVLADDENEVIDDKDKLAMMDIAKSAASESGFESIKLDLGLKLKKSDDTVLNTELKNEDPFPVSENSGRTPI